MAGIHGIRQLSIVNNNVRQLVRQYLKTFNSLNPEQRETELKDLSRRLSLYKCNNYALETNYQKAALIYLRYLRLMEHHDNTKKDIQHSERAHALLSASSASRWLNCTPSPRLEEGFKNESSSYAEEGTLAHEFAELRLWGRVTDHEIEEYKYKFQKLVDNNPAYFSHEMVEYVDKHVDYVVEQYEEAKKKDKLAVILIEERVDITHLIEEGFGTCDVIIISNGLLEVIDLKYGMGVRVDAEDNSQLKLYGAGALERYDLVYDVHTVRLTITQPRMDSISSWEISADDLRKWGEEVVKPTALIAYEGAGEQKTGDWCKFCKASPRCKAQNDLALEAARKAFTDPQLLTDEELIEVYAKIPNIDKWFKAVADYMYKEALDGKNWEGYKLVDGQSRRAWSDEEAVKEVLYGHYKVEEFINQKIKGIGDLEKLIGKKNFPIMLGEYVKNQKTSPSLVPESDKRPKMEKVDYFSEDLPDEI